MYSEATSFIPPNWRLYDPDPQDLDKYLNTTLVDDKANLLRLWSPYVLNPGESSYVIEALQEIENTLDEPQRKGDIPKDASLGLFPNTLADLLSSSTDYSNRIFYFLNI